MNVRLRGEGNVEEPGEGSVDYPKNPMEEMVEPEGQTEESEEALDGEGLLSKLAEAVDEGTKEALLSADNKGASEIMAEEDRTFLKTANEAASETDAPKVIDSTEATIDELLPESDKEGFDDTQQQDARYDSEDEGGVTKPKTTGPMKLPGGDAAMEGGQIKQREPLADATENAYELSGFHVEMPAGGNMVSQQVTQDFADLDTAKACINGTTYLMPIQGGVKACQITRGAPIICYNERQLLEYVGGQWRKP